MNNLDEDLDDSSLFCKSLIQKHKNINSQHSKQLKLTFYQSSSKTNQSSDHKQVENSSRSKVRSIKNNGDWNLNESRSSYFPAKVSANSCPLCLRSFNTDSAYSAHMKQCAKAHHMTTQQLLEALEMQKKQLQRTRDLGLCSPVVPLLNKNIAKKSIKNDKESYDLALGLALSKSLVTCEKKEIASQEAQKATLEEFGFRSSTAITSRKKSDNEKKKFVLKDRTVEERQKIIVEKVAVVLLDEDVEEKDLKEEKLNQNLSPQTHQVPKLWDLGENCENCNWYVNEIKPLIMLEEEKDTETNTKPILSDNINNEISKLSLPRKGIFDDWKKMINSDFKSDWVGTTKDGQNIYMHSLVLFARCPEILEQDCEAVFQKFNLSTIIILLEYLYCGTLNGLVRSEVNDLFDLVTELKFNELINVLNHLKSDLLNCNGISNAPSELISTESNDITDEAVVTENKEIIEEKDLFTEDVVDLTHNSPGRIDEINEDSSGNDSNVEKSYWSFIQQQKKKDKLGRQNEKAKTDDNQREECLLISNDHNEKEGKERNSMSAIESDKLTESGRKLTDDSETRDLVDEFQRRNDKMSSSDCIIISSESEPKTEEKENSFKSRSVSPKTPSSAGMDYEIPQFDFYNDFHCFSEEQISPVGLQSQSLLMGDISAESLKISSPAKEDVRHLDNSFQEERKETIGYCSTPVSIHQVSRIKSSDRNPLVRKNKRKSSDLSANRILRKSLNLQHKVRNSKSGSSKKNIVEKRRSCNTKRFAKALTNSILNELSKSSVFNATPLRTKNYVEITPKNNAEEFRESVTPSPNYSNMSGSMLKEQLKKYGLKRNLAKSKAIKILNYIYEELHPFYNVETKKMVKMLHAVSPKPEKKSKSKAGCGKNGKIAQNKNEASKEKSKTGRKAKDHLNSSKESEFLIDTDISSPDEPINQDSDGSEFEDDLNETLTQSIPNNPVDLPSVFSAFIRDNPEYHEKILLYEPIWLEELQKKLKETYKKHFKLSDIMDFLDQKCITFRSEAQAKRLQRRNEKKENSKRKKGTLK